MRIHRLRSALVLLPTAALCLVLSACSASESAVSPESLLPLVATEVVVALDLEDRIIATGELQARNHAEISAEVDGRVTELLVQEGAPVATGDAILLLDPARRQLELDAARARVGESWATREEAGREVKRLRKLREQNIASIAALERAETAERLARSRYSGARAELGVAERALAEASVKAPFDGLVVERKVSLGEYVQKGNPLVEVVSLNPIEVVFNVAEIDSGRVHAGQSVDVSVHRGRAQRSHPHSARRARAPSRFRPR